jgi:hypothetical protein
MPVVWNLKKWLAVEHDIYRPSELQALLAEKAGVRLSLQAVSTLFNSKLYAMLFNVISVTFVKFHRIVPMNSKNFVPMLLLCVYMVLKSKSHSQSISRLEMEKKNRLPGHR